MKNFLFAFIIALLVASCGNTIYIVRHAEKETGIDMATMKPATDPPLSYEGNERALLLKQILGSKNVKHIFSTNTLRTISTAKPLKELYVGLPIQLYSSKPDSLISFANKVKAIKRGDVLIVGHSNTVDDIVNAIAGVKHVPADLKDVEYDNLFILKKRGKLYHFVNDKFGTPSK
jgi:broad specificity phosphatase PhoE